MADTRPDDEKEVNQHDHREHGPTGCPGVGLLEGRLTGDTTAGSRSRDPAVRYRLRPSVEVFPSSSGALYLLRPGEPDLVIRDATEPDVALVTALVSGGTGAALMRSARLAPADLDEKLEALHAAGVLLEETPGAPLPEELRARFDRQLPYLAEFGDAASLQQRLRDTGVLILGCGGLGTWALAGLASAGVGRIVLVDDDVVELSNLNRQVLYGTRDLGKRKVERAAAWVAHFDPGIDVSAHQRRIDGPASLTPLLDGVDTLVLAADWPPYVLGRWVDEACRAAGVPFIMAAQVPPIVKVGPTYVPGASACFACHEEQIARAFPLFRELSEHRRNEAAPATTLGPASGLVGTLVAMETMHLLLGLSPATLGRSFTLDMRTFETRWEVIERLADCPACQSLDA